LRLTTDQLEFQRLGKELKFRYLTSSQKREICNGCGPKFAGEICPKFLLTASCDHHDFNYWLGGTSLDRQIADDQFYSAMLDDASKSWPPKSWFYRLLAWRFYRAVREWGATFFGAGRKRSWNELAAWEPK
jgi:hypothetical protein